MLLSARWVGWLGLIVLAGAVVSVASLGFYMDAVLIAFSWCMIAVSLRVLNWRLAQLRAARGARGKHLAPPRLPGVPR